MEDKKRVAYIIGTRPEVIRSATLIKALKSDDSIVFSLVHTGQHYDYLMDKVFFEEFHLSDPDINLEIGSGSHSEQTAAIMVKLEKYFEEFKPDIVAVFGDTNSSLAAAITTVKMGIPLAHIEAGCREYEMDMPEEINRRLIDHCSNVNLTVSELCSDNLKAEKVAGDVIFCGDPLYDVYKECSQTDGDSEILKEFGLEPDKYAVMTAHRGKNVDDDDNLRNIFSAVSHFGDIPVIFPVHPRTKKHIDEFYLSKENVSNLIMTRPLNYHEMIQVVKNSKFAITDSGGLQKEVYWSKKPCVTLRDHTAWIETVNEGVNFLSKPESGAIISKIDHILDNYDEIVSLFSDNSDVYGSGDITGRIVSNLKKYAGKKW